jgi:JmjC domain, hydroxylase
MSNDPNAAEDIEERTATSSLAWKAFLYCRDHPVVTQTLSPGRLHRSEWITPRTNAPPPPQAPTLEFVRCIESGGDGSAVLHDSANDFSEPFLSVPCLIRDGPVLRESFAVARRCWCKDGSTVVEREWFRNTLTDLVPVRCTPPAPPMLDDQGRATECPIQYMSIQEYISHYLDQGNDPSKNRSVASYYLKDWHLQQWLERQQFSEKDDGNTSIMNDSTSSFLYTLPDHLPYDLLNGFLLRFGSISTKDGETNDYRFVYWGPKGSTTALHSDVLQSLSWSYNVCGEKQWTFYVPKELSGRDDEVTIVVPQKAGELMIVPSGWKHSVVNLEETLSINHNWITADIVSQVWNCIAAELRAVDDELAAWSIDDFAARESMLRGCVGLNVSLFSLMLLTRGLDLLRDIVDVPVSHVAKVGHPTNRIRDLSGICQSLRLLLSTDSVSDAVHWTDRLIATLQNEDAAHQVQRIAMDLIAVVEGHV